MSHRAPLPSCRTLFLVGAVATTLCACDTTQRQAGRGAAEKLAAQPFDQAYQLVDSIRLSQSDSAPLVRVSGLDFDRRGRVAIADVSEGNVKVYDRGGQLLQVVGRKGEGPGEFSQPRYPRFTPDGGLYVGDGQLGRVSRFDSNGVFVRVNSYPVIPMMGFELTPNGVALTGTGEGQKAVMFGDSLGSRSTWMLDLQRLRPRSDPDNPTWKFLTQYWLGVDGDSAYIATTLSDSIWSIPLGRDTVHAYRLHVPGYVEPRASEEMPKGARELMQWQKTFHIAAKVIATRDVVAIPFVQGVLNFGDPMILAVRRRGEQWIALTGAPPILHAHADTLVGLLHPDDDPPTLGLYIPRGQERA